MPLNHWYAACFSSALGSRTVLGRVMLGVPVVLFRGPDGAPAALPDRCPHRNVPLSLGRCTAGTLQCAYHGWRFASDGTCVEVPGQPIAAERPSYGQIPSYPVLERDGVVWVVPTGEQPRTAAPPALPHVGDASYTIVRQTASLPGGAVAAIENALDVPHTAFLHRGLLRGRHRRVPIEVIVRRGPQSVEAEYVGEPVPPGLVARVLTPHGGVVEHVDRFLAPSLAQVEYRLGPSHLVITTAFTPTDADTTALHATVAFRSLLPGRVVAAVASPIAHRILAQDSRMLGHQRDNIARFGGEHFVDTPLDLLRPHILDLLARTPELGLISRPMGREISPGSEQGEDAKVEGSEESDGLVEVHRLTIYL
jgi:phenylpropionate dioxygenase-like ring-hydroxylating dioxygenase large terminal subunit